MNKFILLISFVAFVINVYSQPQIYTSQNNEIQNWEDNSTWTKSQTWMGNNPGTNLNWTSVEIYGYVTRNGDLSNGGSTVLNIYDTLVVTGNLSTSTPIHVHSGGLLIVLGNLTVTNAGQAAIINEGNVVGVGEFFTGGDITTDDSFYIFDDTPGYDWGATVDGTNWSSNNPPPNGNGSSITAGIPTEEDIPDPLREFLESLGISCVGINTISSSRSICYNSNPGTLTGTNVSGGSYQWQVSTTSSTTGFVNATGSSTSQNYTAPGPLTQTSWFRRRATKGSCSANSIAIQVTVFVGSVWTGNSNTSWTTAANWCGGVPTLNTDVLIQEVPSNRYPIINSGTQSTRNLTITSGASLLLSSNALNIFGDVSNAGTITINNATLEFASSNAQAITNTGTFNGTGHNNALVIFKGSNQQILNSTTPITVNGLTINNTAGSQAVILQTNVNVNRQLTMTSGYVDLSGNRIKLGTGSVNGVGGVGVYTTGNARFFNGSFERWIRNATVTEANGFLFPMGTASDSRPIHIWTTSNPGQGSLIVTHTIDNTTTTGLNITDTGGPIVRRHNSYWDITAGNGLTGGTYSIKAGGTNFGTVADVTHLRLTRSNTSIPSSTYAPAQGPTSDFLARRTGLSLPTLTGGSIHIGSVNGILTPLPVKLINFSGDLTSSGINLNWSTSTEKDFDYFLLERAGSDLNFTTITKLEGKGGLDIVQSYSYSDMSPTQGYNYYRLKNVDLDGTFEYSKVITVQWSGGNNHSNSIELYPTIIDNDFFNVKINEDFSTPISLAFIDTWGRTVYTTQLTESLSEIKLPVNQIQKGMYFVKLYNGPSSKTFRVLVK